MDDSGLLLAVPPSIEGLVRFLHESNSTGSSKHAGTPAIVMYVASSVGIFIMGFSHDRQAVRVVGAAVL
jgi:hypothetical protein